MCDNMHTWLAYASRCIKPHRLHLCGFCCNILVEWTFHWSHTTWQTDMVFEFCSENSIESILFWHLFIYFGQYATANGVHYSMWFEETMRFCDLFGNRFACEIWTMFCPFPSWWYCICTRSMDWCLMCMAKVYTISMGNTASASLFFSFFFEANYFFWFFFLLLLFLFDVPCKTGFGE